MHELDKLFDDPQDDPDTVTCSRCGEEGLHWADHYDKAGKASHQLFNSRGRPHVCQPNADDFESLA